jgi:KDO2-lipid IV(A) lauroyltransferase
VKGVTHPVAALVPLAESPCVSRSLANRLTDRLTYVAVRVAICVIQALPRPACEQGAQSLARFIARRVKIRRSVVRENLAIAFPEWSEAKTDGAIEAMWEHFLLMVVEIAHAERVIQKTTWRKHLRIHGMEPMVRLLWADRPKVILSGHYGNFELAAYLFGVFGFRIYSVARELDNPLLDRFVTRFRESRGQKILPKKGSAPDVTLALEENGAIGLLGDQAAGPKGAWVEFFGRPASVHKAIGLFAVSSGAPIMVCSATRRRGLFDYDLRLEGMADPALGEPQTAGLREVSQWYTALLERSIRRAPEQYWWVHRRWRGEPAKAKVAAPKTGDAAAPSQAA